MTNFFLAQLAAFLYLASLVLGYEGGHGYEPWNGNRNHGGNYGNHFGDEAANWGHHDGRKNGYDHGWRDADAAHAFGERDSKAHERGDKGWASGARGEKHADADGHDHHADESAAKAAEDEEGGKRYSYFTQGSGPEGFYSKGYFGSNGYEHEAAKAAEAQKVAGSGYKKADHNADEVDIHGHEGHAASEASHHLDDAGREHEAGSEAHGAGQAGHYNDGWKSANENNGWHSGYNNGEGDHHPYSARKS